MKKEYIKPELEEIELILEGSFLNATSNKGELEEGKGDGEYDGDDWG